MIASARRSIAGATFSVPVGSNTNSTTWTVKDNLFEGTALYSGSYTFANSNNG